MSGKIKLFFSRSKVRLALLLGFILLCALGLRFYGINWDHNFVLHPDEYTVMRVVQGIHLPDWPLSLKQLLDLEQSPLNPHFPGYGNLPFYLIKVVGSVLSNFKESLGSYNLSLVGRGIAAIFDTGTVFLVYLLGSRLYSRRTGLLAAAFYAFTVLAIQQAHFCTIDSMLTFFITLTVLFSARVISGPPKTNIWAAVLIGICLGLAIATKITAIILLVVIVAAYALRCFEGESDRVTRASFKLAYLKSSLIGLAIVIPVALISAFVTEPYVFLDWRGFMTDTRLFRGMITSWSIDMPWSRQFIDTTPYLYQIRHLSIWGMGLPLAIAAWGGFLFTAVIAVVKRRKSDILILAWMIPFFLIVGAAELKFLRYFLPLIPFLCLVGARLFFELYGWVKGKWRPLVIGVMVLVIACSVFYSFAHVRIYSRQHPILQVAGWTNANVGPNDIVAAEDWEFPLYVITRQKTVLRIYDEDTPEKMSTIAQQLYDADYFIVLTQRAYGTITRLPERYPLSSRYYELMFSGKLGFEMVYCATSYPSLLGITFVDDPFSRSNLTVPEGICACSPSGMGVINMGYADETFTVFDHPLSMVFKKVTPLSQEELYNLLMGSQ